MNSQQGAPGGSWALRSTIISIGMAGLLAGCQQPKAATGPGLEESRISSPPAEACADIAAAADRVFFEYDSAALRPDARTTLDELASQMQKQPQCRFVIEGHCDERGTREYNLALGERRAQAVNDSERRTKPAQLCECQPEFFFEQRENGEDRLAVGVVEEANPPQHTDDIPLIAGSRHS